ncbi:MAG: choice-of-anchor Q domain-containing protein [Dokdonella sp.]
MFSRQASRHFVPVVGLLLTGAFACSNALATVVCVNSVAALNATLIQASVINQPYTIKIVQGTYAMTSDLQFVFAAPFTMEGGYTQNCASRAVDPANTVLDIGYGHSFYWGQESGSPVAQINLEGVTFKDANLGVSLGSGYLNQTDGGVNIKQVRFTNISGDPAVEVVAVSGPMVLENILIDNVGTSGACSVSLVAYQHASIYVNHMTADLIGNKDFCLTDHSATSSFSIYNSVLWSSDAVSGLPVFTGDLNPQSSIKLVNDLFLGQDTIATPIVQNQINADPKWVNPAASNYRLQNASPAINSGTLFTSVGEPATDIEGHVRLNGSAPDRGAYESLVTDQSTLLVTNTNDSGANSLRDAILTANGNSSPKLIKFDIRNAVSNVPLCPAVIALNSVLPQITGSVTIDGYTQSGSTVNTSPGAFNANLCVIVKAASGALPYGFWVPANSAGSVVLRGLGIGGFGQPVHILSGQGSQIIGNQFGGTSHGVDLPGAGLSAIVFGAGATGNILVGGSALGDRNVIGNANGNGIDSQVDATWSDTNCQILNNLIGLAPNGVSALPNNFGINVTGSGCQIVGNRIAGNTITNLWLQGGYNVVQQNLIGLNVQDSGFLNNATGILVTGSGNMIGADTQGGSFLANTVRFNVAGGVVVKGDGAIDNAINANRIYGNGSAGDGMDIDLWPTNGVAGPTPNDSGDADAGPNHLQNFPVPKSLAYTAAGSIDRPATLTATLDTLPGAYRVDVYFSNYANANTKRGHAEVILTHTTVLVPASGTLSFTIPITVPNQSAAGVISMTATSLAGSTSEISTALSTDTIFTDGID